MTFVAYPGYPHRIASAPVGSPTLVPTQAVWLALRRGWTIIVMAMVVSAVLVVAGRKIVPPLFPASVQILVDPKGLLLVPDISAKQEADLDAQQAALENIRRTLTSNDVLGIVVRNLQLDADPEFSNPGALSAVRHMILGDRSHLPDTQQALLTLRERVAARSIENTTIVEFSALALTPAKSARIANETVRVFLERGRKAQADRLSEADAVLAAQQKRTRAATHALDQKAEDYRRNNDLIDVQQDSLTQRRVESLVLRLGELAARRRALESRLEQFTAGRDAARDFAFDSKDMPSAAGLQTAMIRAERRVSELRAQLGDRHPDTAAARKAQEEAARAFGIEVSRLMQATRAERDALVSNEAQLQQELTTLRAKLSAEDRSRIGLREYQRQAGTLADVENDITRGRSIAMADRNREDISMRVISDAAAADDPWRISTGRALLFALIVGALLGSAMALFQAPAVALGRALPARETGWIEKTFVVLSVIMATSAFYPIVAGTPESSENFATAMAAQPTARGNLAYVMVWLIVYGLAGLLFLRDVVRQGIERSFLLALPVMALIFGSSIWAESSNEAAYFGTMFCANILIAYMLAQLVDPARFIALTTTTLIVLLVCSFIYLGISPNKALAWSDGRGWFLPREFSGIFSHKLHSGTYAGMAALCLLFANERIRIGFGTVLVLALCVVTMALANSATAVVGFVLIGAMMVVARLAPEGRLSRALFIAFLCLLAFSVLMPVINLGSITSVVGRDANLTGRGNFWSLAWDIAAQRPLGGHGYTTFFDRGPFSQVWRIYDNAEYFFTPNFHNSSLDIVVSFGVPGLLMYLGIAVAGGLVIFNTTLPTATRTLLLGLLAFFTVSSTLDFQFFRHNGLPTVLLFYVFFVAGKVFVRPQAWPTAEIGAPGPVRNAGAPTEFRPLPPQWRAG